MHIDLCRLMQTHIYRLIQAHAYRLMQAHAYMQARAYRSMQARVCRLMQAHAYRLMQARVYRLIQMQAHVMQAYADSCRLMQSTTKKPSRAPSKSAQSLTEAGKEWMNVFPECIQGQSGRMCGATSSLDVDVLVASTDVTKKSEVDAAFAKFVDNCPGSRNLLGPNSWERIAHRTDFLQEIEDWKIFPGRALLPVERGSWENGPGKTWLLGE